MADEKGIKFYLIQTEDGPQLEHLQAEAKKRDPSFQTTYVDTTKQALMDRLNDLMRRANSGSNMPAEEEERVLEVAPSPPTPPVSSKRSPKLERIYDQTGFEQFIWDVPDAEVRRLDALEKIIKERREEIENPGRRQEPAAPSPPNRKAWGSKS